MTPSDRLTPIPGRLHSNVNADFRFLGNWLCVAITGVDEQCNVTVMAQNVALGTPAAIICVSEWILRDP